METVLLDVVVVMSNEDWREEVDELVNRVGEQRRQLWDAGQKLERLRHKISREIAQGPLARNTGGSNRPDGAGAEG
jgi:hypothetical protein